MTSRCRRSTSIRHTLQRSEKIDELDCYVIESLPIDDTVKANSGYSKKITWVRADNFSRRKVEYYDLAGRLLKTQRVVEASADRAGQGALVRPVSRDDEPSERTQDDPQCREVRRRRRRPGRTVHDTLYRTPMTRRECRGERGLDRCDRVGLAGRRGCGRRRSMSTLRLARSSGPASPDRFGPATGARRGISTRRITSGPACCG